MWSRSSCFQRLGLEEGDLPPLLGPVGVEPRAVHMAVALDAHRRRSARSADMSRIGRKERGDDRAALRRCRTNAERPDHARPDRAPVMPRPLLTPIGCQRTNRMDEDTIASWTTSCQARNRRGGPVRSLRRHGQARRGDAGQPDRPADSCCASHSGLDARCAGRAGRSEQRPPVALRAGGESTLGRGALADRGGFWGHSVGHLLGEEVAAEEVHVVRRAELLTLTSEEGRFHLPLRGSKRCRRCGSPARYVPPGVRCPGGQARRDRVPRRRRVALRPRWGG